MPDDQAIQVYIRNAEGEYLACEGEDWSFASDVSRAHVFDYHADAVHQQLEEAHRDLGIIWIAWPVDPNLVRETCDVCGEKIFPTSTTFDGVRFLCRICRPQ